MRLLEPTRVRQHQSRLRLQTIVRLRWIAVVGQTITVLAVWGLGFVIPIIPCLMVISLSGFLNIILSLQLPEEEQVHTGSASNMLIYDTLQLTALLYLTGGMQNPFAFLFAVPVTVAASTQPRRVTFSIGGLALICATALAVFHLPLPWYPDQEFQLPLLYVLGNWATVVLCATFMGYYAWQIAKEADQMSVALVATESILAREHRLSALDGLAAAAAHELGTPLSTITVVAKELMRGLPKGSPLAEDAELLQSQAERCRQILSRLTSQAGASDLHFDRAPLSQVLAEVVEPYRVLGPKIEIDARAIDDAKLSKEAQKEPVTARNPGVLYGLGNLVENAVDFAGSRVDIEARWSDEMVKVTISDDGPGLQSGVIKRLGEPFVTTRAADGGQPVGEDEHVGLGLGFFIAKTLLERSGAEVDLRNKRAPEAGAVVELIWQRDALDLKMAGEDAH
jgi:two-component system sensor histidine kinase RegB